MNTELSAEAAELGRHARRAFEAAGGEALVEQAERDPAVRTDAVEPVLAQLGAWDLRPREDADELEAAAALCRAAGRFALPHPLAERLSRPADLDADGIVVVADTAPAAAIGGVDRRFVAVTVDGRRSAAAPEPGPVASLSPAVVRVRLDPIDDAGARDVPLALVLPCWTLLGMLDRAIELARDHVLQREQFGQPLASFQGVQFQLTEAEVERAGLDELAHHALWSVQTDQPGVLDDALALRLAAVEAAEVVFRVAHQLHGAIGFCDESPLSWLSRASQPLRRLPWGPSGTADQLLRRVDGRGLAGLFG